MKSEHYALNPETGDILESDEAIAEHAVRLAGMIDLTEAQVAALETVPRSRRATAAWRLIRDAEALVAAQSKADATPEPEPAPAKPRRRRRKHPAAPTVVTTPLIVTAVKRTTPVSPAPDPTPRSFPGALPHHASPNK